MQRGQAREKASSRRRKRNVDDAAIVAVLYGADKPLAHGAADQAYDGVVALLQEFREFGDGRIAAATEAGNPEHELVLLRSNAALARSGLAEPEKNPERVAEAREVPDSVIEISRSGTRSAVSRVGKAHRRKYIALRGIAD